MNSNKSERTIRDSLNGKKYKNLSNFGKISIQLPKIIRNWKKIGRKLLNIKKFSGNLI